MPRAAERFSGERIDGSHIFRNWLGNISTPVASFFRPDSLESLVFVVREAHRQRRHLRVVGNGWSFEDIAASPDWMVDIGQLNSVTNLGADAFTATSILTDTWARRITNDRSSVRLAYVEAGIELFDLNRQLHDMRMAMPTLGGSQGQTLAGAISTSTHGGDVGQPPLPDVVRAVHLITNEGDEWWVESASDRLTNDEQLRVKIGCPDLRIVRDDEMLRALQVSIGRFGVIHAYVIETTTRFGLAEFSTRSSWAEVAPLLREGLATGDLFGPLHRSLPPPRGREFTGLVTPLGGSTDRPRSRYLEFVLNPRNSNDLWVRRRWMVSRLPELASAGASAPADTLPLAVAVLMGAAAAIQSIIPLVASIFPVYGFGRSLELQGRVAELNGIALEHGLTLERALVAALNALWASDEFHTFGHVIDELVSSTFNGRPEFNRGPRRGVSWQITSGLDASPGEVRVNSTEVVFDATRSDYIDYLDTLSARGHDFRQAGYISVRYSRRSEALLSMHSVAGGTAVAIEIVSLVGFDGNGDWMRFAEERAIALGGRPHWGQHNTLMAHQVEALYGDKLTAWKEQLLAVVDSRSTFSNHYTRQRGLEPGTVAFREVTAVRRADGRITHLCNADASWSPLPVEEFVRDFAARHVFRVGAPVAASGGIHYLTRPADPAIPPAYITVRHILSTQADNVINNNLQSLPECPRLLPRAPSAEATRRRVTSVIRNPSGGIEYLCNEDEGWMVFDAVAFLEITNGSAEYFVDRGGHTTNLTAQTQVTTWADSRIGNNLASLPDEELA